MVNENNWGQNNYYVFNDILLTAYHIQILQYLSVQFIYARFNKMTTCFGIIIPFQVSCRELTITN